MLRRVSLTRQQNLQPDVNRLYQRQEGAMHFRGKPVSVVGLRRTPFRLGVLFMKVVWQNNSYQLLKKFCNVPVQPKVIHLSDLYDK